MKARHQDDLALAKKAQQGDRKSVVEFVRRGGCIIRFLQSINRRRGFRLDQHSVEDVAQKVFLEVWARIGDYRGEASLETWMWHFCYLQYLAYVQSPKRSRARPDDEKELSRVVAEDPEPGEELSHRFDQMALAKALLEISSEQRRLLERKYFEGRTFDEIAEEDGVAPSTLKDRYYQALTDLQKLAQRWRGKIEKEPSEPKKNPPSGPAKPVPGLLRKPEEEPKGGTG